MKTKFFVKVVLLFGIIILTTGCTPRMYRQDLPTTQTQRHTEVIYGQNGEVLQKKEITDEAITYEPAEKYQQRYYGGSRYSRYYGGGNGYYGGGRSAISVCIIGCGDGGHHGHHGHHRH